MRVKNNDQELSLPRDSGMKHQVSGKRHRVFLKVKTPFLWRIYNWLTNPLRYIFFGERRW